MIKQQAKIIIITIFILKSNLINCSSTPYKHLNIKEYFGPQINTQNRKLYKELEYDDYGIPRFINEIEKKPDQPGDQYFIVSYKNGMPEKSLQIGIVETNGKEKNKKTKKNKPPHAVIYKWTEKGFKAGLEIGEDLTFLPDKIDTTEELLGCLIWNPTVYIISPVLGGIGGFLFGITQLPYAIISNDKDDDESIGDRKEVLIGNKDFKYDESGRILKIKSIAPWTITYVINETTFYYNNKMKLPYKLINESIPEEMTRTVKLPYRKK